MSKPQPKGHSAANKELVDRLESIWENSHVATEYRIMVMSYIKGLPAKEQEKYLKFQVQWNNNQKSHYFDIFRINMRRKITLFKLRTLMKILKPSISEKIDQICQLLANVRELNVEFSEKLIDMVKFYSISIEEGNDRVLQYIWSLINNLHQQNSFILNSELKLHITFSKTYDPFFIFYYQKQKHFPMNAQQTRNLGRLYNLEIHQIYKIINLRIQIVSLKAKIEKRLKQLGINYQRQERNLYREREEEKISNRNEHEVISKMEKQVKRSLYPRAMSNDISPQRDLEDPKQSRSTSNKGELKSSRLGKIIKNVSMEISSPRVSDSFDLGHHLRKENPRDYSWSQSRSERRHKPRLKLVQLEPLSIRLERESINREQMKQHNRDAQSRGKEGIKPPSLGNPKTKKYDYNPLQANRLPGFIKNRKQRPISKRYVEEGLEEERPIKSRNLVKEEKVQMVDQQVDNIHQGGFTQSTVQIFAYSEGVIENAEVKLAQQNEHQRGQKSPSIKMVQQEIQTDRESIHKLKKYNKVDIDCQTSLKGFSEVSNTSEHYEQSEKQQCNDPQQHQEAITFLVKLNKGDDEASLITLDQQYFVDERLTPMKRFKIPMIRTLNQEELKRIEQKRQSIAKKSKKQDETAPEKPNPPLNNHKEQINTTKRQLKIKIGKTSLSEAITALNSYPFNPKYSQIFSISDKLKQHIKFNHTYILEYSINNRVAVMALASPLPNNIIVIKLWGPMETIETSTSEALFQKFIEYLSKSTANKIIYKGDYFQQLMKAGFTNKKDDVYEKIIDKANSNKSDFRDFFSAQCSNIAFLQKTINIKWQNQAQTFTANNFFCAQFITNAKLAIAPQQVADAFLEEVNLHSIDEVNRILTEEEIENTYAFTNSSTNNSINLLIFDFESALKTCFVAQDDSLLLRGLLLCEERETLIMGVPLMKNNGMLYFGKGTTISNMHDAIKRARKDAETTTCRVKMFNKEIAGQLGPSLYANWQLSLVWEDALQPAAIRHPFEAEREFGSTPFLLAVELSKQIIYSVRIGAQDLLD